MHISHSNKTKYSPIGIDVGTRSINIAQLAGTSDGIVIHDADIVNLPEENLIKEDVIIQMLSDVMKRNNFKGKDVVYRMPPSLVSIVPVKISKRENETIEQAILRESKEYIPYPISDAVIDYLPVKSADEGDGKSTKVLLIFVKRSDVISHLNMLKKIGLHAHAIDIGPNAINRTIKRFKEYSEKRILVINIGHDNSFSTILWDDAILIDRKMGWGLNNITEKLVSNLDVNIDEARRILFKHGIDWSSVPQITLDENTFLMNDSDIPAHIYEIVMPALSELNKEIEKILVYCTSEMKGAMIDKIYLMGSGGFLKHLTSYVHEIFGISVNVFEPGTIFSKSGKLKDIVKNNFPVFMVPIGLALRGYDA